MLNHSHIRHFSSVFVSLRDFQLITQNSSENITSRQSRFIYVNGYNAVTVSLALRELGNYRVIEGYCSLFNMATKTTISGFETIRVKFDINSDAHHVVYLKSHSVREEDKRTPNDRTLFVLNVPPYCTKVG